MVYIVRLYGYGDDMPADCDPDFYPTREAAEKRGPVAVALYDWAERYDIEEIDMG